VNLELRWCWKLSESRSFERAEDDGYCETKCYKNEIDIILSGTNNITGNGLESF